MADEKLKFTSPLRIKRLGKGNSYMDCYRSDELIRKIENLSKLEISGNQREAIRQDLGDMLSYFQKMKELDTGEVEPLFDITPVRNVFREDKINPGGNPSDALKNAPEAKGNLFVVPSTFSR